MQQYQKIFSLKPKTPPSIVFKLKKLQDSFRLLKQINSNYSQKRQASKTKILPFTEEQYFQLLEYIDTFNHTIYKRTQYVPISPSIIKQLAPINFPLLTILQIGGNQIDTLQPLSWLNAPFLVNLKLYRNKITSLKPLTKISSPYLIKMYLFTNFFNHNQLQYVSRVKGPFIKVASFSWNSLFRTSQNKIDCVSSLLKMESTEQIESPMIISHLISEQIIDQFQVKHNSRHPVKHIQTYSDITELALMMTNQNLG